MFAPVLKMALDAHDLTPAVKNGFRACGLYPFDANAVNYNILSKKSKKKDPSPQPDSSSINQDSVAKHAEFLDIFEKNLISPAVLQSFKQAEVEGKWNSDPSYVALFESWCKLRKLCSGVELETCNGPPAESTVIDQSAADQQIQDNYLAEETASDMTPEKADNTRLDAPVYFNIQQDSSSIDSDILQNNSFDMSYHATPSIEETIPAEFPASGPDEVELYDELGNRIIAQLITVIDDGTDISDHRTSRMDMITTMEVTSVLDTKVYSQLGVEENSDDRDNTDTDKTSVDVCNKNLHQLEGFNRSSNEESSDSQSPAVTMIENHENSHDSTEVPVTTVNDTLEHQTSPVSAVPILGENNSINVTKNDNINLSINEESNSSTCSSTSKKELRISPKLQQFFPVPTFNCNKKKKATSTNTPSVAVVDDLLQALEQKEAEKREKEQQILFNKQERERARTMKDKEASIVKRFNENKKKKTTEEKRTKVSNTESEKVNKIRKLPREYRSVNREIE